MCALVAGPGETLPPAEPDPDRLRRWLREHLVVPVVLYVLFIVSLYLLLTGLDAWTPGTVLRGHTHHISCLSYSPDGARIVTGSGDGTARVWDASTGECLAVLETEKGIRGAAFHTDGVRVLAGGGQAELRLWDTRAGRSLVLPKEHGMTLNTAAFSPDGGRMVTANVRGDGARLWDVETGRCLAALAGLVVAAAFSPDGRRIATAGYDRTARIWDATDGACLARLREHTASIACVAFSPDGAKVVTGGYDGAARVWEVATGECVAVLDHPKAAVLSAAFSPDGSRIATGSDDKKARMWDASAYACLSVVDARMSVWQTAFSPDGERLLLTGRNMATAGGQAIICDARTGAVYAEFSEAIRSGSSRGAFAPDSRRVAVAFADAPIGQVMEAKAVRIWRRRRPEPWWGVLWLKDLWITLGLACAFGLALWRDLRRHRAARAVG